MMKQVNELTRASNCWYVKQANLKMFHLWSMMSLITNFSNMWQLNN